MSPTSKKIVGGVLALLFVVTIAQSYAISGIAKAVKGENTSVAVVSSENQAAQLTALSANCVQVVPASDSHTSFIDGRDLPQIPELHTMVIGFKVKNRCNQEIAIVADVFIKGGAYNVLETVKAQDFNHLSDPTTASQVVALGPIPTNVSEIDAIYPVNLMIPSSNLNGVPSSFDDGDFGAYTIAGQGEKDFIIVSHVYASLDQVQHYTRLILKKFRWFRTASFNNDSLLSSNEVYTYNVPNESFSTSYANFNDPFIFQMLNNGQTMRTGSDFEKSIQDFKNKLNQ